MQLSFPAINPVGDIAGGPVPDGDPLALAGGRRPQRHMVCEPVRFRVSPLAVIVQVDARDPSIGIGTFFLKLMKRGSNFHFQITEFLTDVVHYSDTTYSDKLLTVTLLACPKLLVCK